MIKEKYAIKDFLPLISIFAMVLIVSIGFPLATGGDAMFGMRVFMGSFFLVFGVLKLMKLKAFAEAYQMYDIIAMRSKGYAYLYPFIEVGLGIAYFVNTYPLFVNSITAVLMVVSAIGVYLKLRKREPIMCACLGTVFKVPMTWVTLAEDLLMAVMAIGMIINIT